MWEQLSRLGVALGPSCGCRQAVGGAEDQIGADGSVPRLAHHGQPASAPHHEGPVLGLPPEQLTQEGKEVGE